MSSIDRALNTSKAESASGESPLPQIPVPAGAKESLQEALVHAYAREVALVAAEDQQEQTANALLQAGRICVTPSAFESAWAGFQVWYRSPEGLTFMREHNIIPDVSKSGAPKLPNTLKSQYSYVHKYLQVLAFQEQKKVPQDKRLPALTQLDNVGQVVKQLSNAENVVLQMQAAKQGKEPSQEELRAATLRVLKDEAIASIRLNFGTLPIKDREAIVKAAQHAAQIAQDARKRAADEAEKEAKRILKEANKLRPPEAAGTEEQGKAKVAHA